MRVLMMVLVVITLASAIELKHKQHKRIVVDRQVWIEGKGFSYLPTK